MFSIDLFASKLELIIAISGSLVVAYVFMRMSFSYTAIRANQQYAHNREPAPSIGYFNFISKFMFVTSMLLTVLSFWLNSEYFLTLYRSLPLQITGLLLVVIGYFNLDRSFKQLGTNYSPSFDAYLPTSLVTHGRYRVIRHPIYLFNLFVSFGLAITSGSLLVMINALVGLFFLLKIIRMEETCLLQHFPNYKFYADKTWRLVPFCY